jgi:6-phosphogluconolactonase (cycloisomerase 2 family)
LESSKHSTPDRFWRDRGNHISADNSTPSSANTPSPIVTTPVSNAFIYRVGTNADKIFRASVNTGVPTFVYSYPTTEAPVRIIVEPLGRFLYVVEYDLVESYTIAANSQVTWSGATSSGSDTRDVTIDSTGKYLYKGSYGTGVQSYQINQSNGTLGRASSTSGVGINALRLNPATGNLFGVNFLNGEIYRYDIDPTTGVFSNGSFMNTANLSSPYYDLQINAAGTAAYALGYGLGLVSSFSIDQTSGEFNPINAGTLPSGALRN